MRSWENFGHKQTGLQLLASQQYFGKTSHVSMEKDLIWLHLPKTICCFAQEWGRYSWQLRSSVRTRCWRTGRQVIVFLLRSCAYFDGINSQLFADFGVGLRQGCVLSPLLVIIYTKRQNKEIITAIDEANAVLHELYRSVATKRIKSQFLNRT